MNRRNARIGQQAKKMNSRYNDNFLAEKIILTKNKNKAVNAAAEAIFGQPRNDKFLESLQGLKNCPRSQKNIV
jgi:hypothetical protein